MADREFETDEARKAYLAGVEDTAKKMQAPPLTLAEIRKMSPQEVAARMPEVREALKRGDGEGEEGENE